MVQRRARLAGLSGNWAAHSLRSGFVTAAGRQGVPLGEVMALTEHSGVSTVMGYFQAGALLCSRAPKMLEPTHRWSWMRANWAPAPSLVRKRYASPRVDGVRQCPTANRSTENSHYRRGS